MNPKLLCKVTSRRIPEVDLTQLPAFLGPLLFLPALQRLNDAAVEICGEIPGAAQTCQLSRSSDV